MKAPVSKTEPTGVLGRNSAAFKHESRRLNPREKHPVTGVDWQRIGKGLANGAPALGAPSLFRNLLLRAFLGSSTLG